MFSVYTEIQKGLLLVKQLWWTWIPGASSRFQSISNVIWFLLF